MSGFSNYSMKSPRPGLPHMALISGWWRVSPQPKPCSSWERWIWKRAHVIAHKLNTERRYAQAR